jgi:hypothetical protein
MGVHPRDLVVSRLIPYGERFLKDPKMGGEGDNV